MPTGRRGPTTPRRASSLPASIPGRIPAGWPQDRTSVHADRLSLHRLPIPVACPQTLGWEQPGLPEVWHPRGGACGGTGRPAHRVRGCRGRAVDRGVGGVATSQGRGNICSRLVRTSFPGRSRRGSAGPRFSKRHHAFPLGNLCLWNPGASHSGSGLLAGVLVDCGREPLKAVFQKDGTPLVCARQPLHEG